MNETHPPSTDTDPIWQALDRIITTDIHQHNLHIHGLGPLIAWRLRLNGQPVPEHLVAASRSAAYGTVTAAPLLQSIRDAISGPILVLKGPEIAACYPAPALRPYGDLDFLVPDLPSAERQLIAAGFDLLGSQNDILPGYIHDLPLKKKGTALAIELHRRPGWLNWMNAPSNEHLFEIAILSATGVDGILTLPPVERTLFLADHSWRHGPYHSWLHPIDIALMHQHADPAALESTAAAWGLENLWNRTTNIIDALFYQSENPLGVLDHLWSRHLRAYRSRTTHEYYLATRTKGLAAPTLTSKLQSVSRDILGTFTLRPGKTHVPSPPTP